MSGQIAGARAPARSPWRMVCRAMHDLARDGIKSRFGDETDLGRGPSLRAGGAAGSPRRRPGPARRRAADLTGGARSLLMQGAGPGLRRVWGLFEAGHQASPDGLRASSRCSAHK